MNVEIRLTDDTRIALDVRHGNYPLWQLVRAMQFGPAREEYGAEDGHGYRPFTAGDVASLTVTR